MLALSSALLGQVERSLDFIVSVECLTRIGSAQDGGDLVDQQFPGELLRQLVRRVTM